LSGLPSLFLIQMFFSLIVTTFVLKGFTEKLELQILLFCLFLAIYMFTLVGNLGLAMLVTRDSKLHYPMYYFLGVLSCVDASISSVIIPNMLVEFTSKNKVISFLGCATQMFLFVTFGTTECFLLAAMAYDRYVAIYNPLLYSVAMSPRVYVTLVIASYVGGLLNASVHTVATFSLSFCVTNEIRHVFCDIPPLLAISCSDTYTSQLLLFYCVGSIERKIFSTCGSHLTGVSVYHGTILFTYVRPSSSYALDHDMIVSIFYSIVIPMLNPIIYSLRNKDVKEAMKRVFGENGCVNKVYFHTNR
uniref:Olfactory receptor n=1 Tax=Sus scrofa TaxID=9823 RepID=A0A4X1V448_PIG